MTAKRSDVSRLTAQHAKESLDAMHLALAAGALDTYRLARSNLAAYVAVLDKDYVHALIEPLVIEGKAVQYDVSGAGHKWRAATCVTCPADIQSEIAAKILNDAAPTCRDYVARNGQHYRWS